MRCSLMRISPSATLGAISTALRQALTASTTATNRQIDPPEEGTVHYGPGHRPLCGNEDELALHTRDPHQVAGCDDCLELVVEDLADDNKYGGYCLHCGQEITALGGVAWRQTVRNSCPHCGRPGW